MKAALMTIVLVLVMAGGVMADEPFTAEPTAAIEDGRVTITFAVPEPIDVEVSILDGEGKVVRNLAAGYIGGQTPPPAPLQRGLRQTLQWDGLNDAGEPAVGGPFRARVRTGLSPQFDRFIGDAPANQGGAVGLGVNPEGNLFVISRWSAPNQHYPGMEIKSFDRDGRYLRQIMPYSAQLPEEKRSGVQWIETKDGDKVPLVYHGNNHSIYPQAGATTRQSIVFRADGKMATTNAPMGDGPYGFGNADRRVVVFGPDSSVEDDYLGPRIARREWGGGGYITLALSPDGETIYAAGYRRRNVPVPAVTRTTWDAEGEPEVFLGNADEPGAEPAGLVEPRGLAVDSDGNLYIADNAAGRIAVFSPEGELVNELAIDHPDTVAVHRETGAVYVLTIRPDPDRNHSGRWTQGHNWNAGKRLLKFENIEAEEPMATMDIPTSPVKTYFVLDDSQEDETVLWLADYSWGDRGRVKRFVDRGDSFGPMEEAIRDRLPDGRVPVGYLNITVDPHSEEVWVGRYEGAHSWQGEPSARRFCGRTGQFHELVTFRTRLTRPAWGEIQFSACGQYILHQGTWPELYRFDRRGNPAPWPGRDQADNENEWAPNQVAGELAQGFMNPRGLDAAPDGGFYILHHASGRAFRDGRVSRIGPDGTVVSTDIVHTDVPVGGMRVGRDGSVYVGVHMKPAGQQVPDWFDIFPGGHLLPQRVPDTPAGWGTEPGQLPPEVAMWYAEQYGMLVRFKPEGGKIVFDENGQYFAPQIGGERGGWAPGWRDAPGVLRAEGTDLMWYGLSPIPSRRGTSAALGGPRCNCQTPRFDLDGQERIYVPDPFRFSIAVLDKAGNLITRFGQYGNQDDEGDGSYIPFGWPYVAATSNEAIYVGDLVNSRIVRVTLDATNEAELDLPEVE